MERKLKIELIPDGCWGYNIRTIFQPKVWNLIKAKIKKRANGRCEICGKPTDKLEAHESWEYLVFNDKKTGVVKLKKISAVCKDCHSAIHIERTRLKGDIVKAEDHYISVNGCSFADYRKDLGQANLVQQELSKIDQWVLDYQALSEYLSKEFN